MDPRTDKRKPRVLVDAKKCRGASFINGDENPHFCTRIGCSGRIKYAQNSNIRSYYRSSASTSTSAGKSSPDPKRKLPSQLRYAHSCSSLSTDSEIESSTSSLTEGKGELQEVSVPKRRISVAPSASPQKPFHSKAGSVNQSASFVSSTPSTSRRTDLQLSNSRVGASLGHRNMKSSSASDSLGSSLSPRSKSSRNNPKKKSSADGESSLSRVGGKTIAASSVDTRCLPSTRTMTISNIRNKGNSALSQGGSSSSSSRGKMPVSTSTRMRPSQNEGSHSYSAMPNSGTGVPGNGRVVGQRSISARSYSLPRGCRVTQPTALPPSRTLGAVRFTPSTNLHFLHHYDINGVAEMLLALERIEQDDDMTPEQMLLQTGLFLSSFTVYDQHQDMRLDIDDMSYEELLALEERMGSVSTPLSEEELSKCLRRSIYQQSSTLQPEGLSCDLDDTKCSICQEDYMIGDKIGMLSKCCHRYHESCISQWLRLKNWCPICKASAATSQPSSL